VDERRSGLRRGVERNACELTRVLSRTEQHPPLVTAVEVVVEVFKERPVEYLGQLLLNDVSPCRDARQDAAELHWSVDAERLVPSEIGIYEHVAAGFALEIEAGI
jgi:hypothetical protein